MNTQKREIAALELMRRIAAMVVTERLIENSENLAEIITEARYIVKGE